ncbi:phosphoribosylanthranilate isomerase [Bacillus sp. 2205SS5-2]|uniref:phosphoribosylanthranilate isomerase n=1 Tax=Bacillus sp. 2205SS5-2 TaxID=3109031 RepID=UPI003004E30E
MKVKICGITSLKDAKSAQTAGADMIGFVFARSRRQISLDEAAMIVTELDSSMKTVGVFVNAPYEEVNHIAHTAGLDYVQLHGQESEEYRKKVKFPVINAVSVKEEVDLQQVDDSNCEYLLFDGARAGSGQVFQWNLLQTFSGTKTKLILAGGLSPDNVSEAIKSVKPDMVDVSSGVEMNGKKDAALMSDFVKRAHASFRQLTIEMGNKHENLHTTR